MSWSITRGFETFPFFPSMQKFRISDLSSRCRFRVRAAGTAIAGGRNAPAASSFDRVAVAWDHSRPAARAVADALPMLRAAKQVHVVTFADEKRMHRPIRALNSANTWLVMGRR